MQGVGEMFVYCLNMRTIMFTSCRFKGLVHVHVHGGGVYSFILFVMT